MNSSTHFLFRLFLGALLISSSFLFPALTCAQDAESSEAAPQHVEDITGTVQMLGKEDFRPEGDEIKIALQDAIGMALQYNPNIRISQSSLRSSLANLDETESSYRDQFDLEASLDETLTRRTGGTWTVDPNKGLISENYTQNENDTLFTIGPRYTRTFRNGSTIQVNPELEFEHDSDGAFDTSAGNVSGNNSEDRYSVNLSYNYPINSKPREQIRTNIENAKLSTIRSDYSLYMQKQRIINQIISRYWNIKQLELQVEIQSERLLQAKRIQFINKVKFENEQTSEMDYGQTQVDVMNNEASLISTEGSLRNAIESFNILLGIPIETRLKLQDELVLDPLPMSASEYIGKVTSSNLEIKSLQLSIQQAENSLRIAKMGQQPELTLTSFYNRNDEGIQNMGAGMIFNWNFGDGGATKARVRAQEEQLEQLRIDLWNTERSLVQESYDDLRSLQLELQRIKILEKNVEQAFRTLDNALFTYTNYGEISFRQMQDFQIDYSNSRSQLVQAMVSYNTARANLLQKVHDYEASAQVMPLLGVIKDE